jgi:hypothetical protein
MRSNPFGLTAAAVAAVFAIGSVGSAMAQDTRGVPPPKSKEKAAAAPADPAKAKELGMAEAPPLLTQAGVTCAMTDALYSGGGKTDVDGKKVNTKFYEVACSDGPGMLIIAAEGQPVKTYNCLAINQAKAEGKGELSCTLAGNVEAYKGVGPLLTKAGARCTPSQGRWAGASGENKIDLYEIACAEGGAYVVQAPQPGSTRTLTAVSCLHAGQTGIDCQYLTKPQMVETITKMAAPANRPACSVNDVRYMGSTKSNTDFYELGCTDGKSGYVVEVDTAGKFVKAINCNMATMIGGGCNLTVVASGGDDQDTATYTRLVTKMGYACTVEKYRPFGVDPAGREILELACAGKPMSVVGFIPSEPSQKPEIWNCARADARGLKCNLRPVEATYAAITDQITAAGKSCKVTKTRSVGATPEGSDFVEVGCDGGGALMVEYGPGLEAVKNVYICGQVKNVGGGCKFL